MALEEGIKLKQVLWLQIWAGQRKRNRKHKLWIYCLFSVG